MDKRGPVVFSWIFLITIFCVPLIQAVAEVWDGDKIQFLEILGKNALNADFLREYEKKLEDRSVVAGSIRPLVQFFRYVILRDAGEKAVTGKDGWLFYKPDVEYLYRPSVIDSRYKVSDGSGGKGVVDDPIRTILDFKDQLQELGVELLVVIVPGKPSIYPDLINKKLDLSDGLTHSVQVLQVLRDKGVDVVDLFTPFIEERKRDLPEEKHLYLQRDTHWNGRGVRLAAKEVSNRVRDYHWYGDDHHGTQYMMDSVFTLRTGDIGRMSKLTDLKLGRYSTEIDAEKVKCYQVYSMRQDEDGTRVKELYTDDYNRSRILVLGDSFSRIYQSDQPRGAGWIAHLALELSEPLSSIVNDGGSSTIVRQILSRRIKVLKGKKLVIWEFVERDLRFGAQGWQEVNITPQISAGDKSFVK